MPRSPNASIPAFKLYGETAAWPTPDLMHCESIPERSSLHGWEIKAHRHVDLVQLLYVRQGSAVLEVEGRVREVQMPVVQIVPALSIHAFRFSRNIQGHILTCASPLLLELTAGLDHADLATARCHPAGDDTAHLDRLFESISAEYRQQGPGRQLALHSLIGLLMVWLARRNAETAQRQAGFKAGGLEHVQAFVTLVEQQFRQHWPIARYAEALGISPNHLNALCRRMAGQSALGIINARLLLEAKRCLVYTHMTVNQISDSLGFSEPAYFSRYFKRETQVSPKAFRTQPQAHSGNYRTLA